MIPICMPSHRLETLLKLSEYVLNKVEFTLKHDKQRKHSTGRKRRIEYACDECQTLFVTKLRDEKKKLFPWLCRSCCSKRHWQRTEYQNAVKSGVTQELREKRRCQRREASLKMWADPTKRDEISKKLRERNPDVYSRARRAMRTSVIMHHWKTGQELVCVGSYEAAFIRWCEANFIDFDWQVAHKMPDGRSYIIDAFIKTGEFAETWIEIKGFMSQIGCQKWSWFHAFHPHDSQLWDHKRLVELGVLSR